jgi:hypothetical protein
VAGSGTRPGHGAMIQNGGPRLDRMAPLDLVGPMEVLCRLPDAEFVTVAVSGQPVRDPKDGTGLRSASFAGGRSSRESLRSTRGCSQRRTTIAEAPR